VRSIETDSRSVISESGDQISLKYFLVVEEVIGASRIAFECYGVRVEQVRNGILTQAQCCCITCSMDKIFSLLKALARCSVTPVTLADVVEDWE
jgi:hypothetical protein